MSQFVRVLSLLLLAGSAAAQPVPVSAPKKPRVVRAARLLDVRTGTFLKNPVIVLENERISAVGAGLSVPEGAKVIDLGEATVLPGLIDGHTHLLARMPETPEGYAQDLITKSQAFRALVSCHESACYGCRPGECRRACAGQPQRFGTPLTSLGG